MRIFISYSRKDQKVLEHFQNHLAELQRSSIVSVRSDANIKPGENWHDQIIEMQKHSDLVLLLVSVNFLASHYCVEVEMASAFALFDAGKLHVIPIIIGTCGWKENQLIKNVQVLPRNGKAISEWRNSDEAFLTVVGEIRSVVEDWKNAKDPSLQDDPNGSVNSVPPQDQGKKHSLTGEEQFRDQKSAFLEICRVFTTFASSHNVGNKLELMEPEVKDDSLTCKVIDISENSIKTFIRISLRQEPLAPAEIIYSFNPDRAFHQVDGGFNISINEGQPFLVAALRRSWTPLEPLHAEDAAMELWHKFLGRLQLVS